jgi:hypothetical protein
MRITKRRLRRIIKEELKRELISEVDTSADGSFSQKWERVEVYLGGVLDGISVYQNANDNQVDARDLLDWLEEDSLQSSYLDSDEVPTMSDVGEQIGYDEDSLADIQKGWKILVKLGLNEWDMSDRKELADNIREAMEEGEEQGQSW